MARQLRPKKVGKNYFLTVRLTEGVAEKLEPVLTLIKNSTRFEFVENMTDVMAFNVLLQAGMNHIMKKEKQRWGGSQRKHRRRRRRS